MAAPPTAWASAPFSHKPRSCAACTRAGCCFFVCRAFGAPMFSFEVPSYRRCGWPFRASCSCRGISSPVVCRDERRERTRSPFVECSKWRMSCVFAEVTRYRSFPECHRGWWFANYRNGGSEGGRLFKCRARNPFAPCAGLLCPLLLSFRTQQSVSASRPLLAATRRVLRKSPPLLRDSGGLFL